MTPATGNAPRALRLLAAALALVVMGFGGGQSAKAAPSPAVVTGDGPVRGFVNAAGTMREFLGIPYAAAPVGDLRWRPPQPVTPWVATRDATHFGNHCPQTPTPFGNPSLTEDCLFLNVFAPAGDRDHDFDDIFRHRPVMVWIHGGALAVGESNEFDASKLVEQGVVVVTINYRLGALGFLAHPALSAESPDHISGNYGILDQQAALGWVRRNIAAFGGDPRRVTIFGESAGGLSVLVHLASPLATGLFHRAIIESGPALAEPTLAQGEQLGLAFGKAVGCPGSDSAAAACLRALSVQTVLANQAVSFVGLGPSPLVDGKVLPQTVGAALASGQFNRVPVINGTNHDEWRLFVALNNELVGLPVTPDTYNASVAATLGIPAAAVGPIVAQYPPGATHLSADLALGALGTDAIFACPAHFVDELVARFVPTFAYEFNDENAPQNFLPFAGFPYGASHASEIQYIFPVANPSGLGLNLPQTPLNADQQRLSAAMVRYWTAFASDGNPNAFGTPFWPRFRAQADDMQSFLPPRPDTEFTFAADHQCAFWDQLSGRVVPTTPRHDGDGDRDGD